MDVFVFALDFTLWNTGDTWCSNIKPPFKWEDGKLYDTECKWLRLYPDSFFILSHLKQIGKTVTAASRTTKPEYAKELMILFGIDEFFDRTEIYPGSKITHLESIQKSLKVPINKIVFFDDEERNIIDAEGLGIKSFLVRGGINSQDVFNFLK